MSCLSITELPADERNSYGLPVHPDTEYMGANMIDDDDDSKGVIGWFYETVDNNTRRRKFMAAIGWAFATGSFFGALIVAGAISFWSPL